MLCSIIRISILTLLSVTIYLFYRPPHITFSVFFSFIPNLVLDKYLIFVSSLPLYLPTYLAS
jgi:hypothetical protein